MEPRRWREIERLYHAAASRTGSDRARFLDAACGADRDLRREIESLLEQDASAASFLSRGGAAGASPRSPAAVPRAAAAPPGMPLWARLVVVIAVLRTAVGLALYLAQWGILTPDTNLPLWLYATLAGIFAVFGVTLTFGHKGDARAAWLGALFATFSAQLGTVLLRTGADRSFLGLEYLRVDAFLPACLWYFLVHFPDRLAGRWQVLVRRVADATAVVGLLCVVVNLAAIVVPGSLPPWTGPFLITTKDPGRTYWLIVYGMSLPALPVLIFRAVAAIGADRRRAATFVTGLLAGSVPMTAEVLAEEMIPAYKEWAHAPGVEPIVGSVIFGALAIVPFVTAYSVLFDRIVEVRVVLRTAAQYVLARYTVVLVTLVPFAALALYVFEHREEQIASLAVGRRPLLLGVFVVAGVMAFRLRTRWLGQLDKRYFREGYDARDIVTRLAGEWQPAAIEVWSAELADEIERSLHARATIFTADATAGVLRAVAGDAGDVSLSSTIVRLTFADARPMDVDAPSSDSALSRIPVAEREWLESGRFRLLLGVRRAGNVPIGLIALSAKRSELPYTAADRQFLTALAAAAASALTRLQLGHTVEPSPDPPASECVTCGLVHAAVTAGCRCGGELVPASIPLTLRGVFTFRQRIGAGGMGVVYRAWDQNLDRDVAVKALPRVTPEMAARLKREGRAMAVVTHANLATVYSIENWQGTPLIVQEFLGGGTLAQRMHGNRMPLPEILDLGITLADVLDHLHRHRVIHCDIKPSNIGFTQANVPKLLDFGLARVIHETRVATTAAVDASHAGHTSAAWELSGGWFGTPHFMSPEAALGQTPAPSFDLWALAVVLYEAIAGRRPFDGNSAFQILARIVHGPTPDVRTVAADTPPAIAEFLARALSHDPSRRPRSGAVFATEMRGLRALN